MKFLIFRCVPFPFFKESSSNKVNTLVSSTGVEREPFFFNWINEGTGSKREGEREGGREGGREGEKLPIMILTFGRYLTRTSLTLCI